jgi:hypothetical protein
VFMRFAHGTAGVVLGATCGPTAAQINANLLTYRGPTAWLGM